MMEVNRQGSELLYDTDDVGSMGRAVGSVPTTAGKGQDSIPMIAAKFAMPSGIGAPLHDDIAQSMTYLMSNKLEEKSLDEAAEKYLSPENCELLDTPRVNTIMWENLRSATRNKDLKIQYIQKSLTKGLCAFARSLNPATMTEEQHDALALLCNANYGLNSMRKDLIKPDLNPLFHHLCRPTYPVTKHLFGEDLGRQVKELQEQQKATAGVMNTRNQPQDRQQRSYHPYRKVTDYAKAHHETSWLVPQSRSRQFVIPYVWELRAPFFRAAPEFQLQEREFKTTGITHLHPNSQQGQTIVPSQEVVGGNSPSGPSTQEVSVCNEAVSDMVGGRLKPFYEKLVQNYFRSILTSSYSRLQTGI